MATPKARQDRWTYVYQQRSGGGWIVTHRESGRQLGHVSKGEIAPWIAYVSDGTPVGGANTRKEAAQILNLRDAMGMS